MKKVYIKDLIVKGKLNKSLEGYGKKSLDVINYAISIKLDINYLLIPFGVVESEFLYGTQAEDIAFKQVEIKNLLNNEVRWELKPGTLAGELNINCGWYEFKQQIDILSKKYTNAEKKVESEGADPYQQSVLSRVNSYLGESGGNK